VDISNATERRHSPEIAAHAQKHRQRNLDKPATDVQDKPATNGQIKEDSVEISEEGRAAASQLKPDDSDRLAQLLAQFYEKQKQFLASEAEANVDDFLKKIVNGDYRLSKYDTANLNEILSDEQKAKLEQLYEQKRADEMAQQVKQWAVQDTSSAEHFIYNALNGKTENALDIAVQLGNMVFASNPSGTDLETRTADREAGRDLAKYIAENYFDDPKEAQAFMDKINKYIKNSELRDQGYVTWCAEMEPEKPYPPDAKQWFDQKLGYVSSREEYHAYEVERNTKRPLQYSVLQNRTWESWKEWVCDPRYDHDFEENRAWYSDFLKKQTSAQNMINNAKLMITDFSSNAKWNVVMNLLSKESNTAS